MLRSFCIYTTLIMFPVIGLAQVDYNSEIQPIFNSRCTTCHGGSGELSLTSYSNVMAGGNSGAVIIPYNHSGSLLWQNVNSGLMPPTGSDLTQNQVDLIAQWIDEGALEEPSSLSGCTDLEAYNCEDDDVWSNYIFDIGGIMYDNSCNWDWDTSTLEALYVGGCESGPCEGYYDPSATSDNGSCRYYQAPQGDEIVFEVEDDGIMVDWSSFNPPVNAELISYHVQRCLESCTWLPGYTLGDVNTTPIVFDEFTWESGVEIKYAIAVYYANNPYWGWAIGASYITACMQGDINGDNGLNILDVVTLVNLVLDGELNNCGDMNNDGGLNILDVVILVNSILGD